MSKGERMVRAFAAFDAANAKDPNRVRIDDEDRAKELVYAERMTTMLGRFSPGASEPLQLAARSQHLERWRVPRAEYPQGRIGYLQWRKRLQQLHANLATDILRSVGYDDATVARVSALLRKEHLKSDAEAQALEDVAALVFLESYLAEFVAGHPDYAADKFETILQKTADKMSSRGRAAALELIEVPAALAPLVNRIVGAAAAPSD